MKEKKSSIGCLFWIALILLILVIFLFNRNTIETVLENTHFLELFSNNESEPDVERIENNETIEPSPPEITVKNDEEKSSEQDIDSVVEESVEITTPDGTGERTIEIAPEEPSPVSQIRKSRLYFVKVDSEGNITLNGIMRPIYFTDSPLTETLANLLKGLSASEMNQGLLSLIPDGTVLHSVSVKAGTAYLNFNDTFLFNSFGVEGYTAQLQQVVMTALEFSTVDRVQILIDGQKKDYMGIEGGPYIGEPLDAESFK